MNDYAVGYRRPPTASRFKAGTSGNPRGRPKKQSLNLADIIDRVLGASITYRDQGRTKSATREELSTRMLVDSAIKGNVDAAEHVLKICAYAQRYDGTAGDTIAVHNWLPEHPGQTLDQMTEAITESGESDPTEWWNSPGDRPATERKGTA